MTDLYTVDILVNDKPVRKFPHEGKIFVEARKGQTYSIRIKNNSYGRILAVSSVDGLDVLSGKKATANSNGYVINAYNSLTIDGFRVSDEKVAAFEFDLKGESYAATKGDNSKKNCGVIGVRLFNEKPKPEPIVIQNDIHHHHWPKTRPWWDKPYWDSGTPLPPYTITCDTGDYKCSTTFTTSTNNAQTYNMNSTLGSANSEKIRSAGGPLRSAVNMMGMKGITKSAEFDMGTKFGDAKESKVIEVEFQKGIQIVENAIYYASRQALEAMGIQFGNEKQVSFPEPFSDGKYAKPPKNWKG